MELASKYNPADVEGKWYQYWLDNKLFSSKPDGREPYTVVIPPPNVTGVLHMGHMLNNTIQDILVRRARMMGKNACWVPGKQTGPAGNKENRPHKRGIPETCMGMDRRTRRHNPETATQTWRFMRLGPHSFHYGRSKKQECDKGIRRPLQQGTDLPRCTYGELGP